MAVFMKYDACYCKYPIPKVGRRIKYKTEKVGYSRKLAERYYARKYEEYKERQLLGLNYGEKRQYTFGELVEWYLDLEIVKSRKTFVDIRRIALLLGSRFGDRFASEIKPSDVETYQIQRLSEKARKGTRETKKKVSPGAVNREIAVMKRIYNLAIREELVQRNPCWKVSMLKETARDRVISHTDFERLVSLLPQHSADIVTTAYYTGMRRGEILSLTWSQVNLKDRVIVLENRKVYLFNDQVLRVFVRRNKVRAIDHDFVLTYKNKPIGSIKRSFARACRRGRIKDFKFHDLRHCFVTNMRKAGVHTNTVMKMVGHKSLSMFTRYNSVTKQDAEMAFSKLDDFLEISTIVPPQQVEGGKLLTPNHVSASNS